MVDRGSATNKVVLSTAPELDRVARQKLLEEKKRLEANLAQVLWEDGQEPSEDDQLSWKMRLREIELELGGKSTITREDKCICLEVVQGAQSPGGM